MPSSRSGVIAAPGLRCGGPGRSTSITWPALGVRSRRPLHWAARMASCLVQRTRLQLGLQPQNQIASGHHRVQLVNGRVTHDADGPPDIVAAHSAAHSEVLSWPRMARFACALKRAGRCGDTGPRGRPFSPPTRQPPGRPARARASASANKGVLVVALRGAPGALMAHLWFPRRSWCRPARVDAALGCPSAS